MDWTEAKRAEAETTLRRWAALVADRPAVTMASNVHGARHDAGVVAALADDLNTHAALQRLNDLYREARPATAEGNRALALLYHSLHDLLGIDLVDVHDRLRPRTVDDAIRRQELGRAHDTAVHRDRIAALVAERVEAKRSRDFDRADALRDRLAGAGVLLKDTPAGPQWEIGPDFDPARLEARE
jgi:cysteinyl-tRNA synthetase